MQLVGWLRSGTILELRYRSLDARLFCAFAIYSCTLFCKDILSAYIVAYFFMRSADPNYNSSSGTVYKETLIDNSFAFQYLIGIGLKTSPKFELKLDYFNYFSDRSFYSKYDRHYLTLNDVLSSGSMNISLVTRL